MKIVLVHGWGFTPAFWEPVRSRLTSETLVLDLGFFGAEDRPIPADEPVLAVGHSLGLMWLLTQAILPAGSRIIGINGFTRFGRADTFPMGVSPRVLERMLTALQKDPHAVLRQFLTNCRMDVTQYACGEIPSVERLAEGLKLLKDGDARGNADCVQALLASRDDPIVSSAMSESSVSLTCIHWAESGGHLLPLSRPELCVRFIEEAANV